MDWKFVSFDGLVLSQKLCVQATKGRAGVRDEGLIRSALARPQYLLTYNPDVDVADLAAAYAYGLVKNAGFIDANKRMAHGVVLSFLAFNDLTLVASEKDIVQILLDIDTGNMTEDELANWFRGVIQ